MPFLVICAAGVALWSAYDNSIIQRHCAFEAYNSFHVVAYGESYGKLDPRACFLKGTHLDGVAVDPDDSESP